MSTKLGISHFPSRFSSFEERILFIVCNNLPGFRGRERASHLLLKFSPRKAKVKFSSPEFAINPLLSYTHMNVRSNSWLFRAPLFLEGLPRLSKGVGNFWTLGFLGRIFFGACGLMCLFVKSVVWILTRSILEKQTYFGHKKLIGFGFRKSDGRQGSSVFNPPNSFQQWPL